MRPVGVAHDGSTTRPVDLATAVRCAIERIDWRILSATAAIALALSVWTAFDLALGSGPRMPSAQGLVSGTITNFVIAPCLAFATLVADELAARTGRPASVYLWAVVVGIGFGAAAQWVVHWLLVLPMRPERALLMEAPAAVQAAATGFEYLIWGSLIVFLFVHHRRASLAAARLDAARVDRALRQRQMVEARLQALQARVEPHFLIGTLARVRDLYESDTDRAGVVFDQLIAYLRAALPNLRTSISTLRQEVDLVMAYLGVMGTAMDHAVQCRIDVQAGADRARLPAMVLLPLVSSLLGEADSECGARPPQFTIRVGRRNGRLRLEIGSTAVAPVGRTAAIDATAVARRLEEMYGSDYHLGIAGSRHSGILISVEFPDELAESRHR